MVSLLIQHGADANAGAKVRNLNGFEKLFIKRKVQMTSAT